jgi:hypothetical protein
VADGTRRNEAVDAGPDRESGPVRGPEERRGLLEAFLPQRRFDARHRESIARRRRGLVAKPCSTSCDRQAVATSSSPPTSSDRTAPVCDLDQAGVGRRMRRAFDFRAGRRDGGSPSTADQPARNFPRPGADELQRELTVFE